MSVRDEFDALVATEKWKPSTGRPHGRPCPECQSNQANRCSTSGRGAATLPGHSPGTPRSVGPSGSTRLPRWYGPRVSARTTRPSGSSPATSRTSRSKPTRSTTVSRWRRFFATRPQDALGELRRVVRPGGTFYRGVNYYQANHYAHEVGDRLDPEMLVWSAEQYRSAFRAAGFRVAAQSHVPDTDTEIPPADAFPTAEFETRAEMVERYRELGTLPTVGVVP